MPANIAIGGFQHETNTFAPHKASFEEFVKADGWPGLTQGDMLYPVMAGRNLPLSGFIDAARQSGHRLYPMLWCAAGPSSYVTNEAFERVADMFSQYLRSLDDLDAVYLDLHGAMVVEDFEDGEGELLSRVREIIGPDMPLIVSLDLHANVTTAMVEQATAIAIYRTYPHLDMAETGSRASELMDVALTGKPLSGGMRKIPFLFPLTSQCTDFEPCKSIYAAVSNVAANESELLIAEFATGFPPADIAECGAAVVVYGTEQEVVDETLDRLFRQVMDAEPRFVNELLSPDEAVQKAMSVSAGKPVVLADAQDNPGAGGTSDTTGVLEALIRNGAKAATLAVMYDPEVAGHAHEAGVGAQIEVALGAKSGFEGVFPYKGRFEVEALGDGHFDFTGEMYKGSVAELGPMALLRVLEPGCDVRIIVGSERGQCLDLAIIRHLGIEPTEQSILVVKSTVHFRADFDPIAAETLVVAAPGAHPCQLVDLPYKNLRRGVRLEPMGPEHQGPTQI
ncbi:MAG: M81 family metallopeptidase [Gammaproteobacteria bacterium]|nr:M81 family metallopeptidase [Gammaproteobacteria bacterium]